MEESIRPDEYYTKNGKKYRRKRGVVGHKCLCPYKIKDIKIFEPNLATYYYERLKKEIKWIDKEYYEKRFLRM